MMRTFSPADVFRAKDAGVHVLGLYDHGSGMGREYLFNMGVDQSVTAAMERWLKALVSRFK
ncbi:MAG TPA: hypothetical protein VK425_06495 [Acidimicrobiales bacterium]|nr:hypothetical protein [Acidimicrobiales bacterium]